MKKILNTFLRSGASKKRDMIVLPDTDEEKKLLMIAKGTNVNLETPFLSDHQNSKAQKSPLTGKGRMVFLGSIFLLFLFGVNIVQKVQSVEQNIFQKEKEVILEQVESVQKAALSGEKEVAHSSLADLQQRLEYISDLLGPRLSPGAGAMVTGFESVQYALDIASLLTNIGDRLLLLQDILNVEQQDIFSEGVSFLNLLETVEPHVIDLQNDTHKIISLLSSLAKGPVPRQFALQLEDGKNLLKESERILSQWVAFFPSLKTLLGKDHPHTIFVLLQNKNELRATGGFMGSILELTLEKGVIAKQDLTDIFHYSGQFSEDVPVPRQFAHLTGGFFPHDSNIYPDFPDSAENIQWFLEHATADTPDTLIAIHQGVLEDLLRITGPLPLPDGKGLELDAQNASFLLSYLVEAKVFGSGGPDSPKGILENILPLLKEKLSEIGMTTLLPLLEDWTARKYVQIFSRDEDIQKLWRHLRIDGSYLPSEAKKSDFLGITQENIGGNKSDAFVTQHIQEQSLVNLEGEMFHTIRIRRNHTWATAENKYFEELHQTFGAEYLGREELRDILGAGINRSFTSVYLPKGSRILSTSSNLPLEKIEHLEEEGATIFQFFFPAIGPGQGEEVELFIASPITLDTDAGDILSFSALFQSGSGEQYFTKHFLTESGIDIQGTEFDAEPFQKDIHSAYLIQK